MNTRLADSTGVLIGLAIDAAVGDPSTWHPVAGFGQAATALQSHLERDHRVAGVGFVAAMLAPTVVVGSGLNRWGERSALRRTAVTAVACVTVVAGRSLRREAKAIQRHLDAGDLDSARERLRSLCGRDAETLDTEEIARAVIESVAENTNDAVVGPLVWWAAAGVPGLLAYRAINTLDAMVGHHSARYERFGWAAARLDDVANLLPARLAGLVAVVAAPAVSGEPAAALRAWRADAPAHPSPNAGVVEAAFAGSLGVRLGGRIDYPYGPSNRPLLNDEGKPPSTTDIGRAIQLSRAVQVGAAAVCVAARLRRMKRPST